jgi:predicted Zn finger-like uncharacterized protein
MSTVIDCPSCRRKLRVPEEFVGKAVRCPTCGETFDAAAPAASPPPPAAPEPAPAPPPAPAAEPSPILTVPIKLELDDPAAPAPAAGEKPPKQEAPPRREREKREERDDRDDRRPPRRRRRDFEPCPRCEEDVRRGAVVCPYCGLDLEEQGDGHTRRMPVRHDAEPHRGGVIQGLGIASLIAGVFYIFFWIGLPLGLAAWIMGGRDLRKMEDGTMDPNGRKKTRDGRLCGIVGTILNCVFACLALVWIFAVVMAVNEAQQQPPVWQNNPPVWKNNPPPGWKQPAPPQGNNFTLSGPQQVVTLRRGEAKTITLNVNRVVGWRGKVVVTADNLEELDGLDLDPDEVKVLGGQATATFKVTAERDADFGERELKFSAGSDDGDDVDFTVRVKVVGGR